MRGTCRVAATAMVLCCAGCFERHVARDPELPCHVGVWACAPFEPRGGTCGERSTELLGGDCVVGHGYMVFLETGELWVVGAGINAAANRAVVTVADLDNRWSVEGDELLVHHVDGWPGWAIGGTYPATLSGCSRSVFEDLGESFQWLFFVTEGAPSPCPRVDAEIERYLLDLVPTLEPGMSTEVPWPG